jgi:hypothetical protein
MCVNMCVEPPDPLFLSLFLFSSQSQTGEVALHYSCAFSYTSITHHISSSCETLTTSPLLLVLFSETSKSYHTHTTYRNVQLLRHTYNLRLKSKLKTKRSCCSSFRCCCAVPPPPLLDILLANLGRLGLLAHQIEVSVARDHVAGKRGVVGVAELVLLAPLLDHGRQLVVMHV